MVDISLRYLRWYQYILELFPLWIIISFSYVGTGYWPPVWSFLLMTVVAAPLMTVGLYKMGGRIAIYGAIPFLFILAIFLGFDFPYAVLMAVALSFRIENRFIKPDQEVEEIVISITFILALVSYLITFGDSGGFSVYFLLIFVVQLFVWVLGRLIYFYIRDQQTIKHSLRKKLIFVATTLASLGALSYLAYIAYPYLKWMLGSIGHWLLYGFVWVLTPLFNFIEGIELDPPQLPEPDEETEGEFDAQDYMQDEPTTLMSTLSDYLLWLILLIIVTIGFILYRRYRQKLLSSQDEVREGIKDEVTKESSKDHLFWRRNAKAKPPKHQVRKAYFQLERWAAKKDVGRYHHETIEEWFERIGLADQVSDSMLNTYERVRYKEDLDLPYDQQTYLDEIEKVKSLIKEKYDV
ncbi:cation:proton antiporter [Alkalibacillus aidingensis]|uniref:hypothetical protein n=1 Tax=Alkalibacillus aidingensis TaxID=2747607 RepID=UPI00166178DB|nr:hypothetical protein [Alkalibacillus aidingensis]